jgi:hypothetical protein
MKKNIFTILILFTIAVERIDGKIRGGKQSKIQARSKSQQKVNNNKKEIKREESLVMEKKAMENEYKYVEIDDNTVAAVLLKWREIKPVDKKTDKELYVYINSHQEEFLKYAFFVALGQILSEEIKKDVQLDFNVKSNNKASLEKMKAQYIKILNENINKFSNLNTGCKQCEIFFSEKGQEEIANATKRIIANINLKEFRDKGSIRGLFLFRDLTKKFVNLVKEFMPLIRFGIKKNEATNEVLENIMLKTMIAKINQPEGGSIFFGFIDKSGFRIDKDITLDNIRTVSNGFPLVRAISYATMSNTSSVGAMSPQAANKFINANMQLVELIRNLAGQRFSINKAGSFKFSNFVPGKKSIIAGSIGLGAALGSAYLLELAGDKYGANHPWLKKGGDFIKKNRLSAMQYGESSWDKVKKFGEKAKGLFRKNNNKQVDDYINEYGLTYANQNWMGLTKNEKKNAENIRKESSIDIPNINSDPKKSSKQSFFKKKSFNPYTED